MSDLGHEWQMHGRNVGNRLWVALRLNRFGALESGYFGSLSHPMCPDSHFIYIRRIAKMSENGLKEETGLAGGLTDQHAGMQSVRSEITFHDCPVLSCSWHASQHLSPHIKFDALCTQSIRLPF